jgi:uncharacterized repeat protein (TIGR02543 family)
VVTKVVTYDNYYGYLPTPTRDNYMFGGWYTQESGNGILIQNDSIVAITSDQTLYAYWIPNTYVVYFDLQGGSCSTTNKKLNYNETYGTLPMPTKNGYKFNGWYTSPSGEGSQITSESYFKMSSD